MHHQTFLPGFTGSVLALWNVCVRVRARAGVYVDVVFDINVKKKTKRATIPGGLYS